MSQGQSPPESLEARLERLRSKMIAGLGRRATSLNEAADRLAGGTVEARGDIRRLAHKLRGSAGTHGLGSLGDEAAALEDLAKSEAAHAEIVSAARALAASAEEITPSAPPEPLVPSLFPPPATPPPPETDGEARLRVLAVDDDESIARLIELTLSRLGSYETTTLGSAEEALEHLEGDHAPYALILVDAMMPGMSGMDLCEELRGRDDHRETPLVILSAASPEELGWESRAEAVSIASWLRKPVRMAELIAEVRAIRR